MKAKERITKTEMKLFIRGKLGSSDAWALKALVRIYENQTPDEQNRGDTVEDNGIGFTGADAEILSSFADQYRKYGRLSPKQMAILKKKMPKYWGQILAISSREKLIRQISKSKQLVLTS